MNIANFPVKVDLTIEHGAYWEFEATHSVDGVPVNFTGCSGVCKFKRNLRDTAAAKVFSTTNGRMTLSSTGVLHIDNGDDYSATLNGQYYYDIFITNAAGKPEKYYTGMVTVNPSASV